MSTSDSMEQFCMHHPKAIRRTLLATGILVILYSLYLCIAALWLLLHLRSLDGHRVHFYSQLLLIMLLQFVARAAMATGDAVEKVVAESKGGAA